MNPSSMEAIGARSGAVARVLFGKPGPYLPLTSEVRRQLLVLESAVALARATAGASEGLRLEPERTARTLRRAAALISAVDAAVAWALASEAKTLHYFDDPHRLLSWLSSDKFDDSSASLAEARDKAEAALKRFDRFGEPRTYELTARAMLSSVFAAAATAEELALEFNAAVRELRELRAADGPPEATELAARQVLKRSERARQEIKDVIGDRADIRHATIALLPGLADPAGEDLPILRIKQESPLEVVVILIGSAGTLVAVLNSLLDVQVKYNTRKEKERAERSRLERELAEDEAKMKAIKKLQQAFSSSEPERLKMQDLAVFDSLEEALEDDEGMKAT